MNLNSLERRLEILESKLCCGKPVFKPTFGDFPETGLVNTLYIDEETGDIYIWNGTEYITADSEIFYPNTLFITKEGSLEPEVGYKSKAFTYSQYQTWLETADYDATWNIHVISGDDNTFNINNPFDSPLKFNYIIDVDSNINYINFIIPEVRFEIINLYINKDILQLSGNANLTNEPTLNIYAKNIDTLSFGVILDNGISNFNFNFNCNNINSIDSTLLYFYYCTDSNINININNINSINSTLIEALNPSNSGIYLNFYCKNIMNCNALFCNGNLSGWTNINIDTISLLNNVFTYYSAHRRSITNINIKQVNTALYEFLSIDAGDSINPVSAILNINIDIYYTEAFFLLNPSNHPYNLNLRFKEYNSTINCLRDNVGGTYNEIKMYVYIEKYIGNEYFTNIYKIPSLTLSGNFNYVFGAEVDGAAVLKNFTCYDLLGTDSSSKCDIYGQNATVVLTQPARTMDNVVITGTTLPF